MEIEAGNLRLASYRIHQSLVTKPVSINDYWPLRSDKKKESEQLVMDRETYAEIKKAYKLK